MRAHPAAAAAQIAKAAQTTDVGLQRAQIDAVRPILDPTLQLKRPVLEDWATFATRIGMLEERPDVGRSFDFDLDRERLSYAASGSRATAGIRRRAGSISAHTAPSASTTAPTGSAATTPSV